MPTKLVLIRHGQTIHNATGKIAGWTDSPLSAVGQAQALRLAAHVAGRYRLIHVYASPLERARVTAQRVADRFGLQPILRDDLKEINFGHLEGLTHAEVALRFPGIWQAAESLADDAFAWPGGESAAEFVRRVGAAFAEIARSHPGETIAVVAHGGVLGAHVGDLVEQNPRLWARYVPGNCSVTEVQPIGGRPTITCFNDCSFLVDDTPELARASLVGALPGAGLG